MPDLDTFIRLCRWLGVSPERFVAGARSLSPEMISTYAECTNTPEIIAAYLRADQVVDSETADALLKMLRKIYDARTHNDVPEQKTPL